MEQKSKSRAHIIYYLMLFAVVVTWGLDPIVNSYFYNYFSASALILLSSFVSTVLFFIISVKKLKLLNKRYLKTAVPICALNALACLLQRIGLQYTTPASYAFLEQLACVVVPIMMFVFTKKRPTVLQIVASAGCLVGCFILTGLGSGGISFSVGNILCASAGIIFGICIAATGAFTKGLDITLYMLIHMLMYFLVSLVMAVSLAVISPAGVPLESFVFPLDAKLICLASLFGAFSVGICWLLRTAAVRNLDPAAVAVISPFAAVITGAVSLVLSIDKFTPAFAVGSAVILVSMAVSCINDVRDIKLHPKI